MNQRLFALLLSSFALFACSANSPTDAGAAASSASSASSGSTMMSMGMMASGSVSVTFTPIDNNGHYSPDNVCAVWITDANGKWVANLGVQAQQRARYLTQWRSVYTSTITKGVDGVTGATAASFTAFSGTWNASAASAGTYTLHMEFTTNDAAGPHDVVQFSTANGAVDTTASFTYHKNVHLVYTP